MVDQATTRVRGCCGSSAEMRLYGEPVVGVCSHPDLSGLLAGLDPAASPMASVAETREPVRIEDTLRDTAWPVFSTRALQRGIRCVYSAAYPVFDGVLTCTFYSLRVGGLPQDTPGAVDALLQEWSDTLTRASAYAVARTEAHHLGEAITAKELIEQAKGMLMMGLKCDAETAYTQLQTSARRAKIRTVDMARRMIERGAVAGAGHPGGSATVSHPPTAAAR